MWYGEIEGGENVCRWSNGSGDRRAVVVVEHITVAVTGRRARAGGKVRHKPAPLRTAGAARERY